MKDIIIEIITEYIAVMLILWLIFALLNISFSIKTGTAIWLLFGLISYYLKK